MFPRQPVTHKHLPQAIETSAVCVCVCTLPGRAGALLPYLYCQSCSHTGTTGACGLSSLRRHSEHTTLPPAAPELLMDTWACCCRALVFQLLCLPLPLFSPSYLAAQCTSSKGGGVSTFTEIPPPLCLKRWAGGNKRQQNGNPTCRKPTGRGCKDVTEALIATHPYNHIPLLEYCSYLMPFVVSVDKH